MSGGIQQTFHRVASFGIQFQDVIAQVVDGS